MGQLPAYKRWIRLLLPATASPGIKHTQSKEKWKDPSEPPGNWWELMCFIRLMRTYTEQPHTCAARARCAPLAFSRSLESWHSKGGVNLRKPEWHRMDTWAAEGPNQAFLQTECAASHRQLWRFSAVCNPCCWVPFVPQSSPAWQKDAQKAAPGCSPTLLPVLLSDELFWKSLSCQAWKWKNWLNYRSPGLSCSTARGHRQGTAHCHSRTWCPSRIPPVGSASCSAPTAGTWMDLDTTESYSGDH